jgi:hypothetical protein
MEKIDVGRGKKRREKLGAEHGERCYPIWRFYQNFIGSQWPGGMAN